MSEVVNFENRYDSIDLARQAAVALYSNCKKRSYPTMKTFIVKRPKGKFSTEVIKWKSLKVVEELSIDDLERLVAA